MVLCLVQFFAISAGYLVTCASLKIWDNAAAETLSFTSHIPLFVQFIRAYGLWFLFVPTAWGVVAASRGSVTHGDASITLPQLVVGITVTAALVVAFALCALYAMHSSYGRVGSTPFHN